jgi:hypothetical protein
MSPDVIYLLLIAMPVVVLMVLRANASLVFLSACLGEVLLRYVGSEANDFFDEFMPSVPVNDIKLILLLLPVVLTAVFMMKTVSGGRLAFNVLPALGTGLLLSFLIVPLLPSGFAHDVRNSTAWNQAQNLQALIVGVSALTCLFFLWLQRPKSSHDGKHGKHH